MTGTLAVYTLIISFGICICTPRLKKQSSIILEKKNKTKQNKHKPHEQMNHKKDKHFERKNKFRNRTETKGKHTNTTPESQHKINRTKESQKLRLYQGKRTKGEN